MCINDFRAFLEEKLAKPDPLPTPEERHAELQKWERFALARVDKPNARSFEPLKTRGDFSDRVIERLQETENDENALRDVFIWAHEELDQFIDKSQRAIQATRLNYEMAFEDIMREAVAGNLTRRRWSILLRGLNSRSINQAYRDGLEAGGVFEEPDESEQEAIADFIATSRGYVTQLGLAVFKDEEVTPEMARQKPLMWWNKSIMPAYYAGFESAARNQMMEFAGPDGEESCTTCTRLKTQRHRLKDWIRKQLQPGVDTENFECNGFRCEHVLIPVQGKARGRW